MIIALICFAVTNSTLSNGNTASQHPYDSGLLVRARCRARSSTACACTR